MLNVPSPRLLYFFARYMTLRYKLNPQIYLIVLPLKQARRQRIPFPSASWKGVVIFSGTSIWWKIRILAFNFGCDCYFSEFWKHFISTGTLKMRTHHTPSPLFFLRKARTNRQFINGNNV